MNALSNTFRTPLLAIFVSVFLFETALCISQTQPKQTLHQLQAKAQQGDADAQFHLGLLYEHGSPTTPRDSAMALGWFRRSAGQGDARAENALGVAYRYGDGVPENDAVGFEWFYKAALKGNPEAQSNLAEAYGGHGTPKNDSEKLSWILESARNGYQPTQVSLCNAYQRNTALGTDPTMAYAWCLIAQTAVAEHPEVVAGYLTKVQLVLTPSQSEEAKMLASSWNANRKSGGTMPLHSRSFLSTNSQTLDSLFNTLTKSPTAISHYTRSNGCESGHWVDSVMSDGEILKLEDDSIWKVDSVDTVDSSLWIDTDNVTVCDGKLINTDDNSTVGARQLN